MRLPHRTGWVAAAVLSSALVALPAAAQPPEEALPQVGAPLAPRALVEAGGAETAAEAAKNAALAKAYQNPISDLPSIPLQNNTDYNIGAFNRARDTLNIQPVIPWAFTRQLTLVTRFILPIIYQPDVNNVGGGSSGVGDLTVETFLTPSKQERFTWGIGPAFIIPTATQVILGQGKWGIGPAAAGLYQDRIWTVGALVNNIWSVAGPIGREAFNQMTLQPFVYLNLPEAWYLASTPTILANWSAVGGADWLVPFGGGIGKIFTVGNFPMSGQVQAFWNAIRPDDPPAATWSLLLQVALLFPRAQGGQAGGVATLWH